MDSLLSSPSSPSFSFLSLFRSSLFYSSDFCQSLFRNFVKWTKIEKIENENENENETFDLQTVLQSTLYLFCTFIHNLSKISLIFSTFFTMEFNISSKIFPGEFSLLHPNSYALSIRVHNHFLLQHLLILSSQLLLSIKGNFSKINNESKKECETEIENFARKLENSLQKVNKIHFVVFCQILSVFPLFSFQSSSIPFMDTKSAFDEEFSISFSYSSSSLFFSLEKIATNLLSETSLLFECESSHVLFRQSQFSIFFHTT